MQVLEDKKLQYFLNRLADIDRSDQWALEEYGDIIREIYMEGMRSSHTKNTEIGV